MSEKKAPDGLTETEKALWQRAFFSDPRRIVHDLLIELTRERAARVKADADAAKAKEDGAFRNWAENDRRNDENRATTVHFRRLCEERVTRLLNLVCQEAKNTPASCPDVETAIVQAVRGGIAKATEEIRDEFERYIASVHAWGNGLAPSMEPGRLRARNFLDRTKAKT